MNALLARALKNIPHAQAVGAVLAGDQATETLHAARFELGRFADRISARQRSRFIPRRAEMVAEAQAAYDVVAKILANRGEL